MVIEGTCEQNLNRSVTEYITGQIPFVNRGKPHLPNWIFRKPALGGGDTKLFAMSGAWFGLTGLEVTIALSFLIGGIFSLFAFALKFIKKGDYIPFGPFICVSTFMVWLLGPQFWIESLGDIFWWKYL